MLIELISKGTPLRVTGLRSAVFRIIRREKTGEFGFDILEHFLDEAL